MSNACRLDEWHSIRHRSPPLMSTCCGCNEPGTRGNVDANCRASGSYPPQPVPRHSSPSSWSIGKPGDCSEASCNACVYKWFVGSLRRQSSLWSSHLCLLHIGTHESQGFGGTIVLEKYVYIQKSKRPHLSPLHGLTEAVVRWVQHVKPRPHAPMFGGSSASVLPDSL